MTYQTSRLACVHLACLLLSGAAAGRTNDGPQAGDPGSGADRDVDAAPAEARPERDPAQEPPKPGRREFNFFPIAGGDSDVGIGGGQVSNWARLGSKEGSFIWRLEDAVFVTFKVKDGDFILPFLDVYVLLTIPRMGPGGRLRLEARPSFTDERTLGYYGIGNASEIRTDIPDERMQYRRIHPTLAFRLRFLLVANVSIAIGNSLTYSWPQVSSDSLLAQERASGTPAVRRMLSGFNPHPVNLFEVGFDYDTRDNETVTRSGQYHGLLLRYSPAIGDLLPHRYLQLNAMARFYATIVPRWLFLSWRLVWDAFLGSPPFYELARFDDTPAIGGGKAIRGVPAQRYHGKVKAFGNVELQSELVPFTIRRKPMILGAAVFFDAGRTWTELSRAHGDLDGTGVGLKYGIGCGLRLQQGKTFIVRGDIAWSPDARPIGGYFAAGQIF